ncbi:hypothetical protein Ocin01_04287 [Orchesella cincta]|uniref:Protein masquerade clip-domain domain-containing protein n=1 Tax=Orchesella cincta TaxID=48709 RepID=A0A1D2NAX4_ORCCI|nr:hypothetical protein Ocin01_04287 [Orchesella cincta]
MFASFKLPSYSTLSSVVFIFVSVMTLSSHHCDGSTYSTASGSNRHVRQLGFGLGTRPYSSRQSNEISFFQTMMSLNFDMSEIVAMYSNVTALAETPGCYGHCRTPMALWMVQSFYPCYSLKKVDCPKGLVCCMQDPSTRIASANTIQSTRVKGSTRDSSNSVNSVSGGTEKGAPTAAPRPTESTTLFDEEWYRNNFIQDEIPE